jgi:hypothetical protein
MAEENVCIDRVLPPELQEVARAAHAKEHDLAQASPFEMALVTQKMWKPGRTLKVCFLDGDPAVRTKIADTAKQWMDFANINLQFVDGTSGDIRISLKETGYWSAVGTDALVEQFFPKTGPTMNFQNFSMTTPDEILGWCCTSSVTRRAYLMNTEPGGRHQEKDVVYRELGGRRIMGYTVDTTSSRSMARRSRNSLS